MLKLSPGQLSLSQLRAIAAGFDPIVLASECETQVRASAATVRDIVSVGKPAYGINTGFGKLAKVQIPADPLEQLQANLVRSHAAGVGSLLEDASIRLLITHKIPSPGPG